MVLYCQGELLEKNIRGQAVPLPPPKVSTKGMRIEALSRVRYGDEVPSQPQPETHFGVF